MGSLYEPGLLHALLIRFSTALSMTTLTTCSESVSSWYRLTHISSLQEAWSVPRTDCPLAFQDRPFHCHSRDVQYQNRLMPSPNIRHPIWPVNTYSTKTMESLSKPIMMRTVLIGLIFSVIVSLWGQYASAQMNYSYITRTQIPLCLLVPFLLLILFPNLLLRLKNTSNALTTSELITIFCMGLVASTVARGLIILLIYNSFGQFS